MIAVQDVTKIENSPFPRIVRHECFVQGVVSDLPDRGRHTKGYAKCDEKDEFDPEVGKRIALARAESRLYWKARTEVNAAIKDAEKMIRGGKKFVSKAYRVMAHNEMYLGQYCPPKKKSTSKLLSDKAKAQTRDEKGRFTACTKTETTCQNNNKATKQGYDKKCFENNKKSNTGEIKIRINRV